MSDHKRPPGYVSLTIHELASSGKGRRGGSGLDYVYSQDARGMDDSVLGSSAARAVTGLNASGGRIGGGGGRPYHGPNGGQGGDSMQNNNGGRRRNRRNNNRNRRGGRDGGPNFGRDGEGEGGEWGANGNTSAGAGQDEGFAGQGQGQQQQNGGSYSDEPSGFDEE